MQVSTKVHSKPQKHWDTSSFFLGIGGAADGESPGFRQYVFEKAREAVDLENLCPRGRGMWEKEQSGETTEGSTLGDGDPKQRGRSRGGVQP